MYVPLRETFDALFHAHTYANEAFPLKRTSEPAVAMERFAASTASPLDATHVTAQLVGDGGLEGTMQSDGSDRT